MNTTSMDTTADNFTLHQYPKPITHTLMWTPQLAISPHQWTPQLPTPMWKPLNPYCIHYSVKLRIKTSSTQFTTTDRSEEMRDKVEDVASELGGVVHEDKGGWGSY